MSRCETRQLVKALQAAGATDIQARMAAILYAVNGLANALEFVAKIPTFTSAPTQTQLVRHRGDSTQSPHNTTRRTHTMLNVIRRPSSDPYASHEEDEELVITFDQPEARGTVILRASGYGLELILPDCSPLRVALLDFWHTSPAGQANRDAAEPTPVAQLVLDSPAQSEDPLGRVRFFPAQTAVDFELGVTALPRQAGDPPAYGYTLTDYPAAEQVVNHAGVQVFRTLGGDGQTCLTWFSTDPYQVDLTRNGPHIQLDDVLRELATRGSDLAPDAHSDTPLAALCAAIDAGLITTGGWQGGAV